MYTTLKHECLFPTVKESVFFCFMNQDLKQWRWAVAESTFQLIPDEYCKILSCAKNRIA